MSAEYRQGAARAEGKVDTAEIIRHIKSRLASLQEQRRLWEGHWKQLASHFLPRSSRFLSDSGRAGARSNPRLYDSTGIIAARTLAAGLQGGLTSPVTPWFRLSLPQKKVVNDDLTVRWLASTQEKMVNTINQSNFYEQIHLLYAELAVMGTGCMLMEEDEENIVRFKTLTAGEYFIDTDAQGRVDTLYMRQVLTARQIVDQWGEAAPEHMHNAARKSDATLYGVVHVIEPSAGCEHIAANTERPYASYFLLEYGEGILLERGGYYEFPALCPRWDVTGGESYGRSPAMDALPDCRMLQRIRRDTLQALSREVRPPLNVTSGAVSVVPDVSPDAINYIPTGGQSEAVKPLYQVRSNLQAAEVTIQGCREQIKEAFFNDLFLMLSRSSRAMTATEVMERNAEKMLMVGPVLDRLRSEVFQPLVERVYSIMSRAGFLDYYPYEKPGQRMQIEFVSILAQAQKSAGLSSVSQLIGFVGELAAIDGEVIDKLDVDTVFDEVAAMLGVQPGLLRGRESVAARRSERSVVSQESVETAKFKEEVGLMGDMAKLAMDTGAGTLLEEIDPVEAVHLLQGEEQAAEVFLE